MDFSESILLVKLCVLISLTIACSVTDLHARRIPNEMLLVGLVCSLFLSSIAGGLAGLLDALAGLAIGLLMLMPLHVFGRMGAGDIKLLGVVGSLLGAWGAVVAGLATMMAGAVLGVLYLIWLVSKPKLGLLMARIKGSPAMAERIAAEPVRAAEIPYAVAIAAGTFVGLLHLDLLVGVIIT